MCDSDYFSTGVNLGKKVEDIHDGITVAGVRCQPYEETYVPSEEVTCKVASLGILEFREGPVVVEVFFKYF